MCFALYILFKGWSALHVTTRNNNVEVAELLLLQGANVNARTIIYVTEYGTALTTILPILFLYLNTVTVTAGTFEP